MFPSSKDSKNVTPEGQTSSTPVWNVTNHAYDEEIDIYVRTNETLNLCMNGTFSNNSDRQDRILNESFTWINGTAVQLANSNLLNGSGVVWNQTDMEVIGANNYTIDYADGTITLNTSFGDRKIFGINYTRIVSGFDYSTNYTFDLNETYKRVLFNVSIDFVNPGRTGLGIWNWWNFNNCTSQVFIPWFWFASTCSNCVFDENNLDFYNIIRE